MNWLNRVWVSVRRIFGFARLPEIDVTEVVVYVKCPENFQGVGPWLERCSMVSDLIQTVFPELEFKVTVRCSSSLPS